MTALRRRLLEDMQIRNLSVHTQRSYVEQVSRFARHFGQSPLALGPEKIRADQIYLTKVHRHRCLRASVPLQGHAQEGLVNRRDHPSAEKTADVAGGAQS